MARLLKYVSHSVNVDQAEIERLAGAAEIERKKSVSLVCKAFWWGVSATAYMFASEEQVPGWHEAMLHLRRVFDDAEAPGGGAPDAQQ